VLGGVILKRKELLHGTTQSIVPHRRSAIRPVPKGDSFPTASSDAARQALPRERPIDTVRIAGSRRAAQRFTELSMLDFLHTLVPVPVDTGRDDAD